MAGGGPRAPTRQILLLAAPHGARAARRLCRADAPLPPLPVPPLCPQEEFQDETVRKVQALHKYDCMRANKSTMAWGVEARVPFLDK